MRADMTYLDVPVMARGEVVHSSVFPPRREIAEMFRLEVYDVLAALRHEDRFGR